MQTEHFQLAFDTELAHWWFVARRRILWSLIAQTLPDSRSCTVVDVGCGTGGNLGPLSDRYDCVGIDPSHDAIRLARTRFPRCRFICGTVPEELGEIVHRADLFVLADVLEHVPDDFLLLSRLLSEARPGALFLLTVPADLSVWSRHDESLRHYRRYDRQRLERLWQGLPVRVLLLSYFNARLYPLIKLIRTVNRWRGTSTGEVDTDVRMPSRWINRTLQWIFAGEQELLISMLRRRNGRGYRLGVSLIAVLKRERGPVVPRTRPADVAPDHYDPQTNGINSAMKRACVNLNM